MDDLRSAKRRIKLAVSAFTLAEMMVVMLIMSIVLAAMAPVITTRMKESQETKNSSPWLWVNKDAYTIARIAMIGQNTKADEDDATLVINNVYDDITNHILFKTSGTILGRLRMSSDSLVLGNSSVAGGGNLAVGPGALSKLKDSTEYIDPPDPDDPDYEPEPTTISHTSNTAVGVGAMANAENGSQHTSIGYGALRALTKGYRNTAVGAFAAYNSTETYYNTAIGSSSLFSNTTGSYNTAVGHSAMSENTTASYNTAVGNDALYSNEISENNTAVGSNALYYAVGYKNTRDGGNFGNNTAVGASALEKNTTGTHNTAVGALTLQANTTGYSNIAIGDRALLSNTTGYNNIAIGAGLRSWAGVKPASALVYNTTGSNNIAIGQRTLSVNTTGSNNIAIGYRALVVNEGDDNVCIGSSACGGYANSVEMSKGTEGDEDQPNGQYNKLSKTTAVGSGACYNVSGKNTACFGAQSGETIAGAGYRNGIPDKVFSKDNVVYIGNTRSIVYIPGKLVIGRNASGGSGYQADPDDDPNGIGWVTITGKNGLSKHTTFVDAFATSDRRLKYVGAENKSGLDKIKQLKIFNYTYKKDEKKTPHVGVMAQDLQKIFPDAVTKGDDGFLRIRLEDMFYALINAVKELDAKIVQLTETIKSNNARIKKLEDNNIKLQKENEELRNTLKQIQKDIKQLKVK